MQGRGISPGTGYGLTSATTTTGSFADPVAPTQQRQPGQGADRAGESHLDSFFAQSGWTQEDVAVVASAIQILTVVVMIYVEAQK